MRHQPNPVPNPTEIARSPYEITDRSDAALPQPRFEDVSARIADLLPYFTEEIIRRSFARDHLTLVIGARAERMFPRSQRWRRAQAVAWSRRNLAVMRPDDAFDVLFDERFAPLRPYTPLNIRMFSGVLRSLIQEVERRLRLDPFGFSLIWIGRGGYVTPLHHDGELVHGRWHLVVRGRKQWDLLPPRLRRVPRMPWWDLHRRFSRLYKSPIPDAWLADGSGARRFMLGPGQMVAWARNWWHRVEIAPQGLTVGLSTRGHRPGEMRRPRALVEQFGNRVVGEIEHLLEKETAPLPITTPADLARELAASGSDALGAVPAGLHPEAELVRRPDLEVRA